MPQAKDTGTKYQLHPISTGPYKFESNDPNKGIALVRNDQYDPATDPNSGRKALPDKITVDYNVNSADIDNRLQAGDLDVDIAGTGVAAETQAKVLAEPAAQGSRRQRLRPRGCGSPC